MTIMIDEQGTMRFVYSDALVELARRGETRRASHVEPCAGGWTADMGPVGGPVLGPFELHSEAIAAETVWLARWLERQ